MNYKSLLILSCSTSLSLAACLPRDDEHNAITDGGSFVIDGGPGFGNANQGEDGGSIATTGEDSGVVEGTPCRARTLVDKVDLLFMVDNSNSMAQEQAALQAQFPKLIRTLTTGERFPGDPDPFPPATDLHLAVVSSDMGLIGVTGITGCAGFGDDGIMYDPNQRACEGGKSGERFLTYVAGTDSPDDIATNFGCLAMLGTGGCGFEQQLESTLKAVWPSVDVNPITGVKIQPSRVSFLMDSSGKGGRGHGDRENKGFLRNDFSAGPSMLGVVLVTDEEDCSSYDTSHFKPMSQLSPSDPNYNIDLNMRCFRNLDNLYPVSRYASSFKTLRGENADLFMFAAIVGVPTDLVDAAAIKGVDFSNGAARDRFYDGLLADPRMQQVEIQDPSNPMAKKIRPSCETKTGIAYPPVRIVELAKEVGENSIVQSICQDDFGPAMDAIIDRVGVQLQDVCLLD